MHRHQEWCAVSHGYNTCTCALASTEPKHMCGETMKSKAITGHIHVCTGDHEGDLHKCADPSCRRWFGEQP